MKKTLLLFAFLGLFSFMAQAQKTCAKSCTKTCVKTAAVSTVTVDDAVLVKAASQDETIERRQCADSGAVSYFRKNTCAVSGKVSFAEVNYDAATSKFVNISPSDMGGEDMKMAKDGAMTGKKKACASSAGKAGCCASKAGKAAVKAEAKEARKAAKATKISLPNN